MQFEYKEFDEIGVAVLDVISSADKFNQWMFETIAPYNTGTILEIGSGIGNISQFFLKENRQIYMSDLRLNYREFIINKFKLDAQRVIDVDIVHEEFTEKYSHLLGKFDSVFCLNVVEHINDDNLAISNLMKLLKDGGNLTVLVPAYQALYNGFDTRLEHYRRYNKKSLLKLMSRHGTLVNAFYFNSIGILGWFVSGKIFKNRTILKGEMKIYNYLVPFIKLIDRMVFRKVGLSVVCIINKNY